MTKANGSTKQHRDALRDLRDQRGDVVDKLRAVRTERADVAAQMRHAYQVESDPVHGERRTLIGKPPHKLHAEDQFLAERESELAKQLNGLDAQVARHEHAIRVAEAAPLVSELRETLAQIGNTCDAIDANLSDSDAWERLQGLYWHYGQIWGSVHGVGAVPADTPDFRALKRPSAALELRLRRVKQVAMPQQFRHLHAAETMREALGLAPLSQRVRQLEKSRADATREAERSRARFANRTPREWAERGYSPVPFSLRPPADDPIFDPDLPVKVITAPEHAEGDRLRRERERYLDNVERHYGKGGKPLMERVGEHLEATIMSTRDALTKKRDSE